jgi:hypothetical protein
MNVHAFASRNVPGRAADPFPVLDDVRVERNGGDGYLESERDIVRRRETALPAVKDIRHLLSPPDVLNGVAHVVVRMQNQNPLHAASLLSGLRAAGCARKKNA